MQRVAIGGLLIVALLVAGICVVTRTSDEAIDTSVSVAEAMGNSDTTGYRRATDVREFTFPRDHGPHPGFNTEWWYLTGNLDNDAGRQVGYQFTIFRVALTPPADGSTSLQVPAAPRPDTSSWATNQFYMGHFAVSDVGREQHHAFERFGRGAAGLAGAQGMPFRVWLEDWQMVGTDSSLFPARLQAAQDGVAIDLTVRPDKPVVLQGDRGLSQKGPGAGNASYYYSYTRLVTDGTVVIQSDTLQVTGASWMDREWSTSALGEDQVGWDWFALQFDDRRELMYYQIRQEDGTPSPYTEGVLVDTDGTTQRIGRDDVTIDVLDTWTSPRGGTYPTRWRLRVPEAALDLTITAAFEAQEMDVSVRYWEGAVRIDGTRDGTPLSGRGYVEMTGYGDNNASPVS